MDEQQARLHASLDEDLGANLTELMADPLCEDVVLNHDGVLWIKRFGAGWSQGALIGPNTALAIVKTVAKLRGLEASHSRPKIETVLPNGARFEGILPPIVPRPIFAIRLRARKVYSLHDYMEQGILDPYSGKWLLQAIRDEWNILVSGSTGSGKTTFLNALVNQLGMLGDAPRLVIIEDTPELQCTLPNYVALLANAQNTMLDCLRMSLRLRPTRIVVGEVRGGEALEMLKAFNTGHKGGFATIHANNAHDALIRLESLVQEAVPGYDAHRLIGTSINAVVHIDGGRAEQGRRVTSIIALDGHAAGETRITTVL